MTMAAGMPMTVPNAPIVKSALEEQPPEDSCHQETETQPRDVQGKLPDEQNISQRDGDA